MPYTARGSVWGKWDLHIHTPESILHHNFGDSWDDYVTKLFSYALQKEIKAIGITDYYLIDGYKKLRNDYLNNDEKLSELFTEEQIAQIKKILILPNIEFRLERIIIGDVDELKWDRKVGYHVILSDEIKPELIESDFLSQIKIEYGAIPGEEATTRPLTRQNLIDLGLKLQQYHQPFEKYLPIFVGMMNSCVNPSAINSKLKSRFRSQYLVGLPADEDLSKVSWNSQGHNQRKIFIKQSHFLCSSNEGTINFALGKKGKEDFKNEFGELKACIWGSDAHDYERLFEPDNKKYTWIKADQTFEGLKQVIYDPELRVKIQEAHPQIKSAYQLIDKVRILDTREEPDFSSEYIEINPDLNAIIGGKSAGKSLLLHHIAKSINIDEVKVKTEIAKSSQYEGLANEEEFEVEVCWANGAVSKLSEIEHKLPLTYIPQMYINTLAEEEGKTQLNDLIFSILDQNENFHNLHSGLENERRNYGEQLSSKITNLLSQRETYKRGKEEIEKIGDKKAITEEIENLKKKIEKLRRSSGFSEHEENKYLRKNSRLQNLNSRFGRITSVKQVAEQAKIFFDSEMYDYSQDVAARLSINMADIDSPSFAEKILEKYAKESRLVVRRMNEYIDNRLRNVPVLEQKLSKEITRIGAELKPLLGKISDQKTLEAIIKKLGAEEKKLREIEEKERQIHNVIEQGKETRRDIEKLYRNIYLTYQKVVAEIAKPEYMLESDLEIYSQVSLDTDKFGEFISCFNKRSNLLVDFMSGLINKDGETVFEEDSYLESVFNILGKISNPKTMPIIRKGISEEDLVRRLLNDCCFIEYKVRFMGDEIIEMSPGKLGLVLLNLILHLSNSEHPILIDQPEDNLDNRTIYEQLNNYIRSRKLKRQIIIVTHNANLVVSANAECVIVGNQDGQQGGVDNAVYKFEYCSGSLENSFEEPHVAGILNQKGIRQHVCEILEGGRAAFEERERKYDFIINP